MSEHDSLKMSQSMEARQAILKGDNHAVALSIWILNPLSSLRDIFRALCSVVPSWAPPLGSQKAENGWYMVLIQAFWRWRQEDCEFQLGIYSKNVPNPTWAEYVALLVECQFRQIPGFHPQHHLNQTW